MTEEGNIRYQRRLDFTPSCLKTYHLDRLGSDMFNDGERNLESMIEEARAKDH